MSEPLLTVRQAADLLGTSAANLYQWIAAGTAPRHIRLGKRAIRFRPEDIEAHLEERTVEPRAS